MSRSTQTTKPENGIFKIQIDTIRPAADDLEKVEADLCNKELLKNVKTYRRQIGCLQNLTL